MSIKSLYQGVFNTITDCLGEWFNFYEPCESEGCVDVELKNDVKIEVANDNPMVTLKRGRKTIFIPRCGFDKIEIY